MKDADVVSKCGSIVYKSSVYYRRASFWVNPGSGGDNRTTATTCNSAAGDRIHRLMVIITGAVVALLCERVFVSVIKSQKIE